MRARLGDGAGVREARRRLRRVHGVARPEPVERGPREGRGGEIRTGGVGVGTVTRVKLLGGWDSCQQSGVRENVLPKWNK